MKTLITIILISISTACFSQDWIVTRSGDSLTGSIIRKASDSLFIYKVIDGDTVGKLVPTSNIKSFHNENYIGYTVPPKVNYTLNQRVDNLEQRLNAGGNQLENAGQNLLLAPVPAAAGGALGYVFMISAFNQSQVSRPDQELIKAYTGLGATFIVVGSAITTYMIIRAIAQIHKAGRVMN